METPAARARAIIKTVLVEEQGIRTDEILAALDSAGLDLVERTGTVCLPVEDMKHLHTSMTINSSHDGALWYRLRELIAAATRTSKKGGTS